MYVITIIIIIIIIIIILIMTCAIWARRAISSERYRRDPDPEIRTREATGKV